MAMVKLYAARDTLEAGHIRMWLDQHGIEAQVLGEHLSAARGELPLTVDTLPAVWINEDDAKKAMVLMKTYFDQSKPHPELEPWTCPACNETIEGQFDLCWNCGEQRPSSEEM